MLRVETKRATIMNADVAGYSRMMSRDALGTIEGLLGCMGLICELVRKFEGRVIDSIGDNLSAEFEHEAAALRCAIHVQRGLAQRNRGLPPEQRVRVRLGLHTGELLCMERRLFGDVVNIASRLQSAAEPEGILISEALAERLDRELARSLTELGPKQFKNIPYAVTTLGVRAEL